jgi:hypothetical protein
MRLQPPFDPIEVGEVDAFSFDFTADVGDARIITTSWTCSLLPYQTATDPAPQARVIATSVERVLALRSPIDGRLTHRRGFFSVATLGGFPASAVGGIYSLDASALLSDGRRLALNNTVLCVSG